MNLNKRILNLALPNIVSNITVPLLGIVDLSLMGHLDSQDYIGAIALGGMIFNFIYWSFGFLRMGTSGFTAQAFGRRDLHEGIMIFGRAMLIAVLSGLVLIFLQMPIAKLSFTILKGSQNVEFLAQEYFNVRIFAAPATLGLYVFYGWYIGMQNARTPMFIAIWVNVINIVASFVFVYFLHMNSKGVALGTLIAQYSGFAVAAVFMLKKYSRLFTYWKRKSLFLLAKYKEFMNVNKDIFIRTMCLIFVFSFFTAKSASFDFSGQFDENILAINTLLMQFFMIFSYLIDGFAYAAEALTGKFVGARNSIQLKKAFRYFFQWGFGISALFTLIYLFGAKYILRILTNDLELISQAHEYLPWVIAIPIVSFAAFLYDGIYIGATASVAMRNTMIISTILFFPTFLIMQNYWQNHSLWFSFVLFLAARGIGLSILVKREIVLKIS